MPPVIALQVLKKKKGGGEGGIPMFQLFFLLLKLFDLSRFGTLSQMCPQDCHTNELHSELKQCWKWHDYELLC